MQKVNLCLVFKTGPKNVELTCSDNIACFKKLSDVYNFKAILDTWVALHSKLTEAEYDDHLKACLKPSNKRYYDSSNIVPIKTAPRRRETN